MTIYSGSNRIWIRKDWKIKRPCGGGNCWKVYGDERETHLTVVVPDLTFASPSSRANLLPPSGSILHRDQESSSTPDKKNISLEPTWNMEAMFWIGKDLFLIRILPIFFKHIWNFFVSTGTNYRYRNLQFSILHYSPSVLQFKIFRPKNYKYNFNLSALSFLIWIWNNNSGSGSRKKFRIHNSA